MVSSLGKALNEGIAGPGEIVAVSSPVRIAKAARIKSAGPMTLSNTVILSGINPSGSIVAAHFISSSLVRVSDSVMA